jgi:uncharacterized protein
LEIESQQLNSESPTLKQWLIPRNNEAELAAFEAVCERLMGFEPRLNCEWIDGYLTGLAAGPRLPQTAEWVSALLGDTFERVFADPQDQASAVTALQARLKLLCRQLDAEALFDDPKTLRLEPLMEEWGEADGARLMAEGGESAEFAPHLQTGAVWAKALLTSQAVFAGVWPRPADEEAGDLFKQALNHIDVLTLPAGSVDLAEHLRTCYPANADAPDAGSPSRDDLIAEALWSVQDLRMFWVEFAPKPSTVHVEAKPGRNDPCHCGSGKKFKKCHGA